MQSATFTAVNTELKYIHSGMTPLLQFLDVHINKRFKDQLKDQYEVWIDEEKKEYTASANLKGVSYEDIVEGVNTTWKVGATDEVILRGFKQCGYIDCSGNTPLHSASPKGFWTYPFHKVMRGLTRIAKINHATISTK